MKDLLISIDKINRVSEALAIDRRHVLHVVFRTTKGPFNHAFKVRSLTLGLSCGTDPATELNDYTDAISESRLEV